EVLTVPNGSQPDAHAAELVTAPQPQSPNGVASDVPAPSAPGDATDRATIVDDAHVDDTTLQDRPGPRDAAGSQLNLIAERRPAGAPSAAATRADAPVPHAASDPTVTDPREPWEQVAKAMHGVRRDADGSHRVTVRLDPPELGTVEIEVHVHGGRLSVHATADSFATRDLLARALPQLRASLEAGGFETGSLEVGARSAGDGSGRGGDAAPTRPTGRAVTGRAARDTATIPAATTAAADSPNRLDLRL
ncbi:MAG TPA: flagellar hook-length control protein FliK, partial [Acidimicrobiales bacterium]